MTKKRYQIQSSCPQCGCSFATHLTAEELKARYGDVPNIELECGECMLTYKKPREEACPEWDKECQLAGKK
jgi:ribosomal protein S27AE